MAETPDPGDSFENAPAWFLFSILKKGAAVSKSDRGAAVQHPPAAVGVAVERNVLPRRGKIPRRLPLEWDKEEGGEAILIPWREKSGREDRRKEEAQKLFHHSVHSGRISVVSFVMQK